MNGLCECGCGALAPIALATRTGRWSTVKGQPRRFINGHNNKGRGNSSYTHGLWHSPEWLAYHNAHRRCTNPKVHNYKDYGGRGIKFLFTSFEQFFAELGPRPEGKSLDRIENDGNYEPGNVHWATKTEQAANQRPRRMAA